MLPICRNVTCHLRFGNISKAWNVSSVVSKYVNTEHDVRRNYSGLSRLQSGLELTKCKNSPLYMANSKRNIEYNLFLILVDVAKQQFVLAKQVTGLDWWAVIFLCTVPLRSVITGFLMKKVAENNVKNKEMEKILKPLMNKEMKELKSIKYKHLSMQEKKKLHMKKMQSDYRRVYKEHNFNPWILLIYNLTPLPIWVANSWALRKLSGANLPFNLGASGLPPMETTYPEMQTEGLLWFTNLCECDPYHILPILTGCSFLLAIELNILSYTNYKDRVVPKIFKYITNFTRAWSVFFIYLAWNFPSAMSFYWFISGMTAISCRLVFLHPKIQKWIYPKEHHLNINENPYRTIATNMGKRYNPKNWFL